MCVLCGERSTLILFTFCTKLITQQTNLIHTTYSFETKPISESSTTKPTRFEFVEINIKYYINQLRPNLHLVPITLLGDTKSHTASLYDRTQADCHRVILHWDAEVFP